MFANNGAAFASGMQWRFKDLQFTLMVNKSIAAEFTIPVIMFSHGESAAWGRSIPIN